MTQASLAAARISDLAGQNWTNGDLCSHDGNGLTRLAKGLDDQALEVAGGAPSWRWQRLVQRTGNSIATYINSTSIIPVDDTVPQSSEGAQVLASDSLSPKSASHILRVTALVPCVAPSASVSAVLALFRDSGTDAVAVTTHYFANTLPYHMALVHEEVAAATTATSFSLRIGPGTAGTLYVNGNSGGRLFGGTMAVRLFVEEIRP